MTPMAFPLGVPELLIILAVVLLLFGGSRLAGLGKSTGRALKEFKEETKGLTKKEDDVVDGESVKTDDNTVDAEWTEGTAKTNAQDPASNDVRKDV